MKIWNEEKRSEEGSTQKKTKVLLEYIQKQEISNYQRLIEEGLANVVYAHRAFKEHGVEHMFQAAARNLLLEPFEKVVSERSEKEGYYYPVSIDITQDDLGKLHRGIEAVKKKHFLDCIEKLKNILASEMTIEVHEPAEAISHYVFIVLLSLKKLEK